MLFATDTRCSYANIVVRKELCDKGVKSVEALGRRRSWSAARRWSRPPPSAPAPTSTACTCCKSIKAADGKPVNDHVEWVGGGASTTMLGGLKAGKFDAIMAVPEWQWAAEERGLRQAASTTCRTRRRGTASSAGPSRSRWATCCKETIEKSPDLVQAYVNACYRAQQWIRRAKDEEIVELLYKPYMDTFTREVVLRVRPLLPDDLRLGLRHRGEGLRERHEGVGPHRGRQADPVRAGGRHVAS